jgi:hypothetical protein
MESSCASGCTAGTQALRRTDRVGSTAPQLSRAPTLARRSDTPDVLVLGAGVRVCALRWRLHNGHRVVVVDAAETACSVRACAMKERFHLGFVYERPEPRTELMLGASSPATCSSIGSGARCRRIGCGSPFTYLVLDDSDRAAARDLRSVRGSGAYDDRRPRATSELLRVSSGGEIDVAELARCSTGRIRGGCSTASGSRPGPPASGSFVKALQAHPRITTRFASRCSRQRARLRDSRSLASRATARPWSTRAPIVVNCL